MSVLLLRDKPELREKAVALRRQGFTYSEILREVPVVKSTLSLWFHDVGLAEHQKQRITEKRIAGQKRGAAARRMGRIREQERIWSAAEREIGKLSRRELWLIGIALYWAEGSKEKEWRAGAYLNFSNSDPRMIRVFIAWLYAFVDMPSRKIGFEIYIHEDKRNDVMRVREFWSKQTSFPLEAFRKVYFKKNKIDSKRKNCGLLYNGVLRVKISRSTTVVRKLEGWARGISHCRVV